MLYYVVHMLMENFWVKFHLWQLKDAHAKSLLPYHLWVALSLLGHLHQSCAESSRIFALSWVASVPLFITEVVQSAERRGPIRGKRAVKIAPPLYLAFRLCTHGSQIQFISQIRSERQSLHFYLQVIRLDLVVTRQASVTPLMTWLSNAVAMFSKWSLAKL